MTRPTAFRVLLAVLGLVLLPACGNGGHGEERQEGHADEGEERRPGEEGHAGDHVVLTPGAVAEAGIETGPAGPGRIEIAVEFPGEVIPDPDRFAHVTPRAAGSALEVRADLGTRIRAGEVLAVLESPELGAAKIEYLDAVRALEIAKFDHQRQKVISANTRRLLDLLAKEPSPEEARNRTADAVIGEDKSRLLTPYANLFLARRTREREEDLFRRKVSAEADLLVARNAHDAAEAEYASARETVAYGQEVRLLDAERALRLAEATLQNRERRLHLLGVAESEIGSAAGEEDEGIAHYQMRSPIGGVVVEKHLVLGETVDSSTTVFVVADLSSVQVRFSIWPEDLARVRQGMPVRFRVDGVEGTGEGKVDYLSPVAQERTRTAEGRVQVPNPEGLWRPGLFGTVRVVLEEAEVPLSLPAEAVVRHEGGEAVFVEEEERSYEARPVWIGRRDANRVEVLGGVAAGDRIVVKGAFVLKAELGKEAGGHDH